MNFLKMKIAAALSLCGAQHKRKNWLHIGSEQAGPLVAAIASIFETCRRLKINPREYLLDVLPRIAEWPASKVAELSPVAWKAKRAS